MILSDYDAIWQRHRRCRKHRHQKWHQRFSWSTSTATFATAPSKRAILFLLSRIPRRQFRSHQAGLYSRTSPASPSAGLSGRSKHFIFFLRIYAARGNSFLRHRRRQFRPRPGYASDDCGSIAGAVDRLQASAVNSLLSSGIPAYQQLGVEYGVLMGSASSVALNKLDYGAVAAGLTGGVLNPGPGAQFPLPFHVLRVRP